MNRLLPVLAAAVLSLASTPRALGAEAKAPPAKGAGEVKEAPEGSPAAAGAKDTAGAQKADEGADAKADPVHVKVGVYVLNIGKYELATGTYTIDFYLSLTSDRDMGDQRFEFMNGRGSLDKLIDKPTEKFYRVQGNLMSNVDLRAFPWDSHVLPIVLEHVTRTSKELVYEVDPAQSGVDKDVRLVGWNLRTAPAPFQAEVRSHEYPVYGESYSQYLFQVEVGRVMLASSLKTFLPVLVFLIVTLVSLLIAAEKADTRITMNTALLIAAVMFHLSVQASLPPVGYLTLADKVMVATYAVIGANLAVAVLLLRYTQLKQDARAHATRARAFLLVPAVAVVAYGIALLTA
jgi:hypothetical protein